VTTDDIHPTSSRRIAVLLGDRSNPFWTAMEREYRMLAPAMDMTTEFFYGDPEKNREAQLDKLLEILALPFDAIVVNPISNRNLLPGIMKAAAKRTPVLDVGAKTDQEAAREAGDMYHPVHTVDFFAQGLMAGTYIGESLSASGGGGVAIIEGRPDSAQSMGRSAGAVTALAAHPTVRLACREQADFDRAKTVAVSAEILRREPDLKAFFCVNDVMALGVAEAVARYATYHAPMIVGVDLTPESRDAIRRGRMTASIAFSPASVARVVLAAADCVMKGGEPEKGFTVTSTLVTKENVDVYTG
jgi:ABC-type sugar transport system substrate-binding protein